MSKFEFKADLGFFTKIEFKVEYFYKEVEVTLIFDDTECVESEEADGYVEKNANWSKETRLTKTYKIEIGENEKPYEAFLKFISIFMAMAENIGTDEWCDFLNEEFGTKF